MSGMRELGYYLGIHPVGALATVIATVLLYFCFVWVLRTWGQRISASPSSLDLAVVAVVGAMVGRATMGRNPTLAGGLVALATLLLCQSVAGLVRNATGGGPRAVAVMVAGQTDREMLDRYRIDHRSLWSALRSAGVTDPREVALVVLEPHGQFSVLRSGSPIHASALAGVRRGDRVLDRLVQAGLAVPRGEGEPELEG